MAESELAVRKLYRYLDTAGDGSGSKHANVDGTFTPVPFKLTCPLGQKYDLQRMMVYVVDKGKFKPDRYGVDRVLNIGITCEVQDPVGVQIIDMFDDIPVRVNPDWACICYDVDITDGTASQNNSLAARWTFAETGRRMAIQNGESLVVTIRDDLTALTDHRFFVQGEKVFDEV